MSKRKKQTSLHRKVVTEILPRFAKKLKREGVISGYSREPLKISIFEHVPPYRFNPDLVLITLNGEKVLIEVANPRDPKRFLGELFYAQILGIHNQISMSVFFVLPHKGTYRLHERRLSIGKEIFETIKGGVAQFMISWIANDYANNYFNLKSSLTEWMRLSKKI